MEILSDPKLVREQYQDSSRLDARVRIYELFSQRADDFHSWVFARLELAPGSRILEVGGGTGNLWRGNPERLGGRRVLFGDKSTAMLRTARERLDGLDLEPRYAGLDAQFLPFANASFDVVIANHMLYHVADRALALGEIHRVLSPGGRFYSTTNGWSHVLEMRELVRRFGVASAFRPVASAAEGWDLEDAAREVGARFADLRIESYRDALRVTDAEPLVDAIRSMSRGGAGDEDALGKLRRHVEWMIGLEGWFHVSTWAGLVTATRRPD